MARPSLVTLSLVLLLAGIVAAATLLMTDFEFSGRDAHLRGVEQRLGQEPVDVVLMGDSVISASSRCDRHHAGIDLLLADRLRPHSLHAIHSGGLSLFIYRDYVQALQRTTRRPKLLLIEINPSTLEFGPGLHPAGRFHTKRLHNAWRQSRDIGLLVDYWRYRFGGEFNREVRAWQNIAVDIPGHGVVHQGDAHKMLERPPAADCGKEQASALDMRIAQGLRLSTQLSGQSEIWPLIEKIASLARAQGMVVAFYLSPANLTAIDRYSGPVLRTIVDKNRALLRQRIEATGSAFFDFSDLVAEERFFDVLCACGHMNADGREQLAEALAMAVRSLLSR